MFGGIHDIMSCVCLISMVLFIWHCLWIDSVICRRQTEQHLKALHSTIYTNTYELFYPHRYNHSNINNNNNNNNNRKNRNRLVNINLNVNRHNTSRSILETTNAATLAAAAAATTTTRRTRTTRTTIDIINKERRHRKRPNYSSTTHLDEENISLWINDQQLKMLTALFFPRANMIGRMYAIRNGSVLYDILDGSAYKYLEYLVLPPEVNYVNFTWKSGHRKYFYNFDRLETLNESILKTPTLSIKTKGRIPKMEKNFSVFLPCNGNNSGQAVVKISLSIHNRKGVPLPGTPLRLNFKKGCAHRGVYDSLDASSQTALNFFPQGPDPECHLKCGEHGMCNHNNICQCHPGYIGQYCEIPVCFPQCMNGGNCTAPSVCTCPDGYQGIKCEGGMCAEKCLNGGKCIKKDKCECPRGYYGLRCEFSKCEISCMHGGRCIGINLCKCAPGLSGDHCEIGQKQRPTCKDNCRFGHCMTNNKCKCFEGYYGRFCNRRPKRMY